ncbi:MAG: glutathione S-transferase [Paraglaciecola sp.]|uniref:glutathione S-transferase family protein n=1 Tax=Pseudomonadati TaxID=3379134 RepID=UPI00273F5715|nr:glutathione S-transferase [Paraglaciecola sp.]MDP5032949.1 glutathione S-transferase [Paraglaciecola sp.]MDP5133682.1 glutathione S-transferase [Paraglaciecola sp.]
MLTLHGFDVSNYFNMIKLALAYKDVEYTKNTVYPNQSSDFLRLSPMGKVPALETHQGTLCETNVILEYLEETFPLPALYPAEPFAKSKVKELVKMCELYLELPARRCHPEVFFGQVVSDATKKEVKRALYKGMEGLARTAKFSPYIAGSEFSAADIMFLYSADLASVVAKKCFDFDLLALAPGAHELMALLTENPHVQKIAEERKAGNIAFKEYIASLS